MELIKLQILDSVILSQDANPSLNSHNLQWTRYTCTSILRSVNHVSKQCQYVLRPLTRSKSH